MVQVLDPRWFEPSVYNAYLVCEIPQSTLDKVQEDWHLGAFDRPNDLRYNMPHNRLNIIDRKDFYGLSPQAVRTRLEEEATEAGKNEGNRDDGEEGVKPFILIDEETGETRSVWYIDHWLDEEELEQAKRDDDEKVLWRLRVATWELPLLIVNYEIANLDIQESLDNSTAMISEGDEYLYDQHAPQQPEITMGEEYFKTEPPNRAVVVAGSGEFEETRNPEDMNCWPKPERMLRLRADLAKEHGFKYEWSFELNDEGSITSDGPIPRAQDVQEGGCKFEGIWDMTLRPPVW